MAKCGSRCLHVTGAIQQREFFRAPDTKSGALTFCGEIDARLTVVTQITPVIAGSFNGRTRVFDTRNERSIRSPAAIHREAMNGWVSASSDWLASRGPLGRRNRSEGSSKS